MYQEGQLLKFSNFVFKNGNTPKTKYFIVLRRMERTLMIASLPTSKDHVPSFAAVESGCVNLPESNVNAFVISPKMQVTPFFSFPLPTFLYGSEVDEYEQEYLESMQCEVEDLGLVDMDLMQAIRDCLKKASNIRRKYIKWL